MGKYLQGSLTLLAIISTRTFIYVLSTRQIIAASQAQYLPFFERFDVFTTHNTKPYVEVRS